jgi:hypothetical protein
MGFREPLTAHLTAQKYLRRTDAIVALSKETGTKARHSFVIIKSLSDYGVSAHASLNPYFSDSRFTVRLLARQNGNK